MKLFTKQQMRCWLYQREIVSQEDYNELLAIKNYESFMDCSGQYDDMQERAEHRERNKSYLADLLRWKTKHRDRLHLIRYPYSIEDNFEVKE